jgi:glucans biosynthesis protein
MFWFGENSEIKPDDYRPEVHDSDGLLVRLENDEFLWTPLKNPPHLQHQTIPAPNVRGFGLVQRDRQFSNYQDLFNYYHRVPSVWIEPRGNWSEGEIHLVELPAQGEGTDNIVAFWNPRSRPAAMEPFRFGYTLFWTMEPQVSEPESKFPLLRAVQTRTGVDPGDRSRRQLVIDFSSSSPGPKPEAQVRCDREKAALSDVQVFENTISKGWRVFFSLKPDPGKHEDIDIQCWLERSSEPASGQTNRVSKASETWRYRWNPPSQKSQAQNLSQK